MDKLVAAKKTDDRVQIFMEDRYGKVTTSTVPYEWYRKLKIKQMFHFVYGIPESIIEEYDQLTRFLA